MGLMGTVDKSRQTPTTDLALRFAGFPPSTLSIVTIKVKTPPILLLCRLPYPTVESYSVNLVKVDILKPSRLAVSRCETLLAAMRSCGCL